MVVIMSEFIHNEYTRKIFQEFESGSGHVFIQARAGTGKTTSLIEMLNHFYDNVDLYPEYLQNALVCFVAFSNKIKKFFRCYQVLSSQNFISLLFYFICFSSLC